MAKSPGITKSRPNQNTPPQIAMPNPREAGPRLLRVLLVARLKILFVSAPARFCSTQHDLHNGSFDRNCPGSNSFRALNLAHCEHVT